MVFMTLTEVTGSMQLYLFLTNILLRRILIRPASRLGVPNACTHKSPSIWENKKRAAALSG